MKIGPKSTFTPELIEEALKIIASTGLVSEVLKRLDVGASTFAAWRLDNPDFDQRCLRALEIGIESQVDSLSTIADEYDDVNRARLKSDNLKWIATKRLPHRYGDKMTLDVNNTIDLKGALLEAKNRMPQLTNNETRDVVDISQLNQLSNTDSESVAETSREYIEAEDFFKDETD